MKAETLTERFEHERPRLRSMARRVLGSAADAEDAVQEVWLRLVRSDPDGIRDLPAWLTTVTGRVCIDMLRARRTRREEPLAPGPGGPVAPETTAEDDLMLADAVGHIVVVMLDRLSEAERATFVLHDVLDMSFDDIAQALGRSAAAVRQLASRARRRLQDRSWEDDRELRSERAVIDAYLSATRAGDRQAVLAVLAPDILLRWDEAAGAGVAGEVRGAAAASRRATAYRRLSASSQPVLIDGHFGLATLSGGRLQGVVLFTIDEGTIAGIELVADPERLAELIMSLPSAA